MANNSPTIVAASLSDDQLKKSIDSLVTHVDEAMKKMVQPTNNAVGEMEAKLKSLGNLKIDSGGSADGGASKRTKAQNAETDAVEKTIAARGKQIKKNQEVKMSYDQIQTALEKATRLPSEMRMPDMAKSARDSFQAFYKGFNEQARKLDALIKAEDNRLASAGLGRFSTETQAQLAKVDASIDQTRWKMNFLYQEEKRLNQEALRQKVGSAAGEQAWLQKYEARSARVKEGERLIELEKERQRIIASDPSVQQLDRNIEQTRAKIRQLYEEEKRLNEQALKQPVSSDVGARLWNQKYAVRDERIANEERLIQLEKERQSLVAVDPIRTQIANMDELRAKHDKVLNIMREETSSTQQQTQAQQQTTQSAQRYTEEIRKQAQAIRESQQWKEKGYYTIWTNKETNTFASVNANDRRSIEEQLLAIYKAEEGTVSQLVLLESSQNASAKERLGTEQAITQEQEKRKKYVSPTINDDAYQITRNAIARKLGIDTNNVINADAQYDSIKRVGDALKQLQDAYTRMTNEERNSPIGKQMIRQMQELQRQSQQLRAQMSRPISLKDALSGSEKTLDDIAYKIRRLQSYMQGLDTSNEKSAAEFQRAALSANLLKEKQNQLLQKNSQLIRSNGELFASNTALGRSWNYMKNRLAFYFTVGASTQLVKELVDIRSQYEMNERALGILINSAERGTQIFNELSQMALVSPYTLIELSNAAKQLTAYDIAAKDVVDTTRRLADMASAVGVPMERLTYALGQIKAYGYLNSRDNRMFANAGIPLVKQLSDYYTELEGKLVSTADVYDRIKNKAVSFEDTMGVIYKMTDEGGKFFDFQEKMAGTLKVQLANLNLAWNNMLNDIGSESQGVLTAGIGALKELFLAWKDVEKVLTEIIVAFGVVKGVQMLSTVAIGKQTVKTLEYVSANKLATASEYKRALSINGLTAEQARWLILTNQSNKALVTAITRMGVLDKAIVKSLATMTGFKRGFAMLLLSGKMAISGLITGFKTLGTAILSNWPMVLLMAGMDLFMHMNQVAENNKELNKTIADGAKEATKALNDFLTAEDKVQIRLDAQNKTLTKAQGEKAWESIREQIELSAISAKQIIPELLDIPDINDRITKSFELAERIQKATEALQGLEDELEVSQDSWLYGAFGEGLEEDIEDYVERIKAIKQAPLFKDASWWQRLTENTKQQQKPYLVGDLAEAKSEIEDFANDAAEVIKERLGEEGIKDKIQVGEAVERIIKETEAKYPKITRGAGKKLFEAVVSDTMGEQFKGVYDAQEQYYKLFLEQLGKDYGSKFRDVTEDIKKDTFDWSEAQEDAINKTAEKIKQDLPEASQNAINQILKQLDTTEFKMRIVTEFATKDNDDVQKAFDRDFYDRETLTLPDEQREKKHAENVQKYQAFRIKAGEDTVEYEKRISDEREKQEKIAKKTQAIIDKGGDSTVLARAKEENKAANQWLANMKEVEKWGGYDFLKDKKGGSKKDPMLDTLKQTIEIVKKLQSEYDTLTKSGASSAIALEDVRSRYSRTINLLNKDLAKFGLPQLNLDMIKGRNPNDVLEYFQKISDILTNKGLSTLERQKAVEVVIQEFSLKAETYNLDMITKGLNNELGKLKDEYELAVELDANPEMGNLFADWMGFDMSNLPHTAEEYAKRMTKALNKYLAEEKSGIEIGDLLALTDDDLRMFQQRVDDGELTQAWVDNIVKNTKEARSALKKENSNIAKEWDNLVQKYSEYEYKIAQIQRNANKERKDFALKYGTDDQKERALTLTTEIDAEEDPQKRAELIQELKNLVAEIAGSDAAKIQITTAIDTKELQEGATISFEEFQKSPEWIIATGDLAGMTDRALKGLIKTIEKYKKSAKNLSPKQIKQINKALRSLHKQVRSGNPFLAIGDSIDRAESRSEDLGGIVDKTKKAIDELEDKRKAGIELTEDEEKKLKSLKQRWKELSAISNVSATDIVEYLNNCAAAASNAAKMIADMADALGGDNMTEAAKTIRQIVGVIDKAGQGAALGAQIGGNYGAIIGGVVGAISGIVTEYADEWSGNAGITEGVKSSEQQVKRLENEYQKLEAAIENVAGTGKIGMQQMAISYKKLELAEMKRQLQLEQSRESKNRDEDKIIELQGKIADLENDIKKDSAEIVNDLLGISSVADATESFMDSFITALRNGEDAMDGFKNSINDMIANMVMKMYTTKILAPWFEEQWKTIENDINARADALTKQYYVQGSDELQSMSLSDWVAKQKAALNKNYTNYYDRYKAQNNEWVEVSRDVWVKQTEEMIAEAENMLKSATELTTADIAKYAELLKSGAPILEANTEEIQSFLESLGLINDKKNDLSALQQGIQGITEDTAGAVESYLNGMSQQAYLRNDLLTQIRDAIVGMDIDVQTATMGEILLQLRSSYEVQMAIHGILEGVLTPSGRAFSVELAS